MKHASYRGIAVLLACLLFLGGSWYVDRANRTHPAPWPNPQGDASGRFATQAVFPDKPSVLWTHPLPHLEPYSPVIGEDGTVYVTAGTQLLAIGADGAKKWTWQGGGLLGWTALGRHGAVYVLEEEALVALDSQGRLSWRLPHLDDGWRTAPLIGQGGVIYVGTRRQLYAVTSEGQIKWRREWSERWRFQDLDVRGLVAAGEDGRICFVAQRTGQRDGALVCIGAR